MSIEYINTRQIQWMQNPVLENKCHIKNNLSSTNSLIDWTKTFLICFGSFEQFWPISLEQHLSNIINALFLNFQEIGISFVVQTENLQNCERRNVESKRGIAVHLYKDSKLWHCS